MLQPKLVLLSYLDTNHKRRDAFVPSNTPVGRFSIDGLVHDAVPDQHVVFTYDSAPARSFSLRVLTGGPVLITRFGTEHVIHLNQDPFPLECGDQVQFCGGIGHVYTLDVALSAFASVEEPTLVMEDLEEDAEMVDPLELPTLEIVVDPLEEPTQVMMDIEDGDFFVKEDAVRFRVSATYIARRFHLSCDRFLFRACSKEEALNPAEALEKNAEKLVGAMQEAYLEKGRQWERVLRRKIGKEHFLEEYHEVMHSSNAETFKDLVRVFLTAPTETRVFAWGVVFEPDHNDFRTYLCDDPAFEVGKIVIDFLELKRTGMQEVTLIILDAKASYRVKTYHVVQIAYYAIVLEFLLSQLPEHYLEGYVVKISDVGGVWLPGGTGDGVVEYFQIHLVKPSLWSFLKKEMPQILGMQSRFEEQQWRFNEACQGCPYNTDCRREVSNDRLVSAIPYLSSADHGSLRRLATDYPHLAYLAAPANYFSLQPDVHKLLRKTLQISPLRTSPVLQALFENQPIGQRRRCHLIPASTSVLGNHSWLGMSLLFNAEDQLVCWTLHFRVLFPLNVAPRDFFGTDLNSLGQALSHVLDVNVQHNAAVQLFVFSRQEYDLFVQHALCEIQSDSSQAAIWMKVISLLVLDPKLLLLDATPDLLLGVGGLASIPKDDVDGAISALGERPNAVSSRDLQQQLQSIVEERRKRFLRSPNVVVVHQLVRNTVCTSFAGYFGFDEACSLLGNPGNPKANGLSLESLFELYDKKRVDELKQGMKQRSSVLCDLVSFVAQAVGDEKLAGYVPKLDAHVPTSVAHKELISKLIFLKQFESVVAQRKLREEREMCTGNVIDLRLVGPGAKSGVYIFQVTAGLELLEHHNADDDEDIDDTDSPSKQKKCTFFEWILFRSTTPECIIEPTADTSFCDALWYCIPTFRLGDSVRHQRGDLYIVDIIDLNVQQKQVILALSGSNIAPPPDGVTAFSLRERYVDFNLAKTVAHLKQLEKHPSFSVFEDLIRDPVTFGDQAPYPAVDVRLPRPCREHFKKFESHGLSLARSQYAAFKHLLSNRLTLLWGPPGTGKTHCLALSCIHLFEILCREGLVPSGMHFRVLVTAFTNTAIETFTEKLNALLEQSRQHRAVSAWANDVVVYPLHATNEIPKKVFEAKLSVMTGSVWSVWKRCQNRKKGKLFFDLLIIDEASQLLVADASIPLNCVNPRGGRVLISGDHLQLRPLLKMVYPLPAMMRDPLLATGILQCLLRTRKNIRFDFVMEDAATSAVHLCPLKEQRRLCDSLTDMTQTLYHFPFEKNGRPPLQWQIGKIDSAEQRVVLMSLSNAMVSIRLVGAPQSLPYNAELLHEAELVTRLVHAFVNHRVGTTPRRGIFVITPHRAQRSASTQALKHANLLQYCAVDTVDRMQGKEADIVIVCYSFLGLDRVESEMDFIFDLNRVNVAISRARSLVVLLCSDLVVRPPLSVAITPHRQAAFGHLMTFYDASAKLDWPVELH